MDAAGESLTKREREVLAHLVEGGRVATVARALCVSPHTVRNHLRSILAKLDVHSQPELLEHVRENPEVLGSASPLPTPVVPGRPAAHAGRLRGQRHHPMTIALDEEALARDLAPWLEEEACRTGIANLANDPFFVAFFLMSVSQGEGLGEAAVGMVGQDELAGRIRDLARQEAEERGHKERTLAVAQELFPELFDAGRYRFEKALTGRSYYVTVLEANRARLKEVECYSRLNLYLTTTFGYEVMVLLLYRAVADAVARSQLPASLRERVGRVLEGILAEEETHLGVVDQHDALLAGSREGLSPDALAMLDALARLTADDYVFSARLAVRQVVDMMQRYADPSGYRAEIEACAST